MAHVFCTTAKNNDTLQHVGQPHMTHARMCQAISQLNAKFKVNALKMHSQLGDFDCIDFGQIKGRWCNQLDVIIALDLITAQRKGF